MPEKTRVLSQQFFCLAVLIHAEKAWALAAARRTVGGHAVACRGESQRKSRNYHSSALTVSARLSPFGHNAALYAPGLQAQPRDPCRAPPEVPEQSEDQHREAKNGGDGGIRTLDTGLPV